MSLVNLSLSGNQLCSVIEGALKATTDASIAYSQTSSYFGGVIVCLTVAVGVVYVGGMTAFQLLAKHHDQQQQTIDQLQRLLEMQQQKINNIEKDLLSFYKLQCHNNNQYEHHIRDHAKCITKHANQLMDHQTVINHHTTIVDNHGETVMNVIRHLHEMKTVITQIHENVEQQQEILEEHYETMGYLTDRCDGLESEIDKMVEQTDQSFCEIEFKLEEAMDTFQESKNNLEDKLEEQANELYSVEEELFDRVEGVADKVESYMDKWTDEMKELGDRVEEVDRSVIALEKTTDKMETELETLSEKSDNGEDNTIIKIYK